MCVKDRNYILAASSGLLYNTLCGSSLIKKEAVYVLLFSQLIISFRGSFNNLWRKNNPENI